MNSQDSVTDQLLRVVKLAVDHGEYDAADWIGRKMLEERVVEPTDSK